MVYYSKYIVIELQKLLEREREREREREKFAPRIVNRDTVMMETVTWKEG